MSPLIHGRLSTQNWKQKQTFADTVTHIGYRPYIASRVKLSRDITYWDIGRYCPLQGVKVVMVTGARDGPADSIRNVGGVLPPTHVAVRCLGREVRYKECIY